MGFGRLGPTGVINAAPGRTSGADDLPRWRSLPSGVAVPVFQAINSVASAARSEKHARIRYNAKLRSAAAVRCPSVLHRTFQGGPPALEAALFSLLLPTN